MIRLFLTDVCFLLVILNVKSTPLDDYVNEPDPHFNYTLIKVQQEVGFKLYILNMTSQKWMDESYVKNPVWWHYVVLTVPDKITRPKAGIVIIDGGKNDDSYEKNRLETL